MADVKQSTVDVIDKADGGKKKMFPGCAGGWGYS